MLPQQLRLAQAPSTPQTTYAGGLQPAAPAPWVFEIGARYVYSSGKNWYDLYNDPNPSQLNSRLTYDGLNAHSGEVFFRVDSPSAIFIKGYYGGGSIQHGNALRRRLSACRVAVLQDGQRHEWHPPVRNH